MKERRKWGKQNENKKVFVIFLRLSNFQISIIGNDISLFYFHSIIIPSSKRFQNIDSIYIYNLLVVFLLRKDYSIMTRFQNYLIFQNANWNTVIDNRLWKRSICVPISNKSRIYTCYSTFFTFFLSSLYPT